MGNHLSFQDLNGQELVSIRQQLLSWGTTYAILQNEEQLALVRKVPFSFFKERFTVEVSHSPDLEAEGDFLDHEYLLTREGHPVASISKRWFSMTDTYGVDIGEEEDDILILAITVVIDMIGHADKK